MSEQKPVAWMGQNPRDGSIELCQFKPAPSVLLDFNMKPLYAHPAPTRQPLTDDQITLIIAECAARHEHTDYGFARAIEAAHGIGGGE